MVETGGTTQYTSYGGVLQQYKAVSFVEQLLLVQGLKENVAEENQQQNSQLLAHTVSQYTYIFNLTRCTNSVTFTETASS